MHKTLKKFVSVMFLVLVVFLPCTTFAAFGNSIALGTSGTRSDLIYIKRPESHSASTSDRTYTISAVGGQGTRIKIYRYNASAGVANIIKGETQIGASGLYSVVVDLPNDYNTFLVTAENGYGTQVVRIDINKIKKSTVDKLKSVTVTVKNFFQ